MTVYKTITSRLQTTCRTGGKNKYKVGLVVNEFFCQEYPPLGGFGLAAKNFAQFFNGDDRANIEVVALLPPYRGTGPAPTVLHDTRVIAEPTSRNDRPGYFKRLRSERFDLLVSINYYKNYFERLASLPRTPWLHWIRDPRSQADWDRIMALASTRYSTEYSKDARHQNEYYSILQLLRMLTRRKFHCGIQETWLIPQARAGLPLLGDNFSRLVNRIPLPQKRIEKSARASVLFVGRLMPIKRPWLFFEIARRLPEVQFAVAGEQGDCQELRAEIEKAREIKNLKFHGNITGQEFEQVMAENWILVNTSLHEAMPQSVLQALSYEMPVVSSQDFGGQISRFGIHTGKAEGDGHQEIESFVDTVKKLLDNDVERKRLGQAGRQIIIDEYSDHAFAGQIKKIFDKMGVLNKGRVVA